MKRYSKKEAAEILGIGMSTLERYMHNGEIQFSKEEQTSNWKGSARVWFTAENLGIQDEPIARALEIVAAKTQPTVAEPERPLTQEERDAKFAADFLAGKVPDSMGNFYNGTNPGLKVSTAATLVGTDLDDKGQVRKQRPAPRTSGYGGSGNGHHYTSPLRSDVPDVPDTEQRMSHQEFFSNFVRSRKGYL